MPQGGIGGGQGTNSGFDLRFGNLAGDQGPQGLFSNPRPDATVANPPSLESQLSTLYSGSLPARFEEQAGLGARGPATLPNPPVRSADPFYSVPGRETRTGGRGRRVDLEEYLEATTRMTAPQLSEIFSRMNMEGSAATSSAPSNNG